MVLAVPSPGKPLLSRNTLCSALLIAWPCCYLRVSKRHLKSVWQLHNIRWVVQNVLCTAVQPGVGDEVILVRTLIE